MLLVNLLFNFLYLRVYMSRSDFLVCVVLVSYITDLIHMEEDIQFARGSINMKGPKKCLVCGRKCLLGEGCGSLLQ